MKHIFFDFTFWFGVVVFAVGFILLSIVNTSLNKQKKRLEDPQKNYEEHMKKWVIKYNQVFGNDDFRIHSNVRIMVIAPAFMMAVGIIAILVAIIK